MTLRYRRYAKEEFARRGKDFYESEIRRQVEAGNKGKFVAIDIETGAWEMDADRTAAGDRLRKRVPDSQTWMMRIGYSYTRRFGAGGIRRDAWTYAVAGLTRSPSRLPRFVVRQDRRRVV